MHLYHYCALSLVETGTEYYSGTMMLKKKIKTNADYVVFKEQLAEHLEVEPKSFILSSLSYLS
jgi:hypothetical protein